MEGVGSDCGSISKYDLESSSLAKNTNDAVRAQHYGKVGLERAIVQQGFDRRRQGTDPC